MMRLFHLTGKKKMRADVDFSAGGAAAAVAVESLRTFGILQGTDRPGA